MFGKILVRASCYIILSANLYADNNHNNSSGQVKTAKPSQNKPTVGSRSGSEQIFGNQKVMKKPNNKLYDGGKKELNNPSVGTRAGSEQIFGNQQSQNAQNPRPNKKAQNRPTVGSRSGSEQVFGHP